MQFGIYHLFNACYNLRHFFFGNGFVRIYRICCFAVGPDCVRYTIVSSERYSVITDFNGLFVLVYIVVATDVVLASKFIAAFALSRSLCSVNGFGICSPFTLTFSPSISYTRRNICNAVYKRRSRSERCGRRHSDSF